ncbi:hypothetical protein Bca52824_075589 [Brassica carinata]|uniref:Uncharacterized protein n=1 Tax=Brassica carinata TaxID=52824 RepID=A0A8X7PRI7_BRACI|nr:hypothetical protein Bca52824_075589 [Brassica carinata]
MKLKPLQVLAVVAALEFLIFTTSVKICDLSLEKDKEEEAKFKAQTKEQVNTPQDLPPRLHFAHQIPGMIISTAEDGFTILMPYNIQNTLPDLAA